MEKNLIKITYRKERIGTRIVRIKHTADVIHSGLNDYKTLTSDDLNSLQSKVKLHVAKLEEKWNYTVQKQTGIRVQIANQNTADQRTKDAREALKGVDNILTDALSVHCAIDWESWKETTSFTEPRPTIGANLPMPARPREVDFMAQLTFWDNIITSSRDKKIQQAQANWERAIQQWTHNCRQIEAQNEASKKTQEIQLQKWQTRQLDFYKQQALVNEKIEEFKNQYLMGFPSAVLEYFELVLNNSQYPDSFPKQFELDYQADAKILVVEYSLPTMEDLPTLNEVKWIKNDLKEYFISEAQHQKLFDATMYKIALRTLYELLNADTGNVVDFVSFNGWVNAINRGTGKRENNCILSIQVKKEQFKEVDLAHVEAKTCFKNFKGVGSSKLSGLTPIQPILQINKTDKRFVNHYEVASGLDSSTNLASMDWEDFEHLIREVFAAEFSGNGGEVRVTQASKDGGVDAIAFDPDPIRGGKIVIQAKRYTNTVGVAAVRDLYGTVMNEGAIKGILVTTADYGPDSYEFVKNKPLSLINGSELLFLLERHGHKARINLKEAKKEMKLKG